MSGTPLRLGWFSTGRGEGSFGLLKAALEAIGSGELNASIEFVFCNRERGQAEGSDRFISFAESNGITVVTLSSRRFRKEHGNRPWAELRDEFDRAVLKLIEPFDVDMTVNAGYMLIAPLLCLEHLMINLHPALPDGPAGMWQNVIWELIEGRATESGAMVHIVTEEVDGGPVLSYCRFSTRNPELDPMWLAIEGQSVDDLKEADGQEHPLFVRLREMGLMRERPLIVETLKAIASGRISVEDAAKTGPIDLTDAVESSLSMA
ncbi:MAG: formyltransferase family protein [Chloroflexi bacterium]|nr:formyltransferase family protein [Chloroflexota bacterium]